MLILNWLTREEDVRATKSEHDVSPGIRKQSVRMVFENQHRYERKRATIESIWLS